jgi:hypothetical protein
MNRYGRIPFTQRANPVEQDGLRSSPPSGRAEKNDPQWLLSRLRFSRSHLAEAEGVESKLARVIGGSVTPFVVRDCRHNRQENDDWKKDH